VRVCPGHMSTRTSLLSVPFSSNIEKSTSLSLRVPCALSLKNIGRQVEQREALERQQKINKGGFRLDPDMVFKRKYAKNRSTPWPAPTSVLGRQHASETNIRLLLVRSARGTANVSLAIRPGALRTNMYTSGNVRRLPPPKASRRRVATLPGTWILRLKQN